METVKIQVNFTVDTRRGPFTSAIYFTEAEWAAITPEQKEAKKQTQVDTWLAALDTVVESPTIDERTEEQKYNDDMEQRAREAGLL